LEHDARESADVVTLHRATHDADSGARMRTVSYANTGDASVLQVVERPLTVPAEGEVRSEWLSRA